MMVYRAEKSEGNIHLIPPELADPTLRKTIFIEEEETGNQVVCRRDGKVRKPSSHSIGRCHEKRPSASFWARRHLVVVELDQEEAGDEDDYVFITWKLATVVTLGDDTAVHVFREILWEGLAQEYKSAETPLGDFTAAIRALQERAVCLAEKGANCAGPHYADLEHVEDLEQTIADNEGRRLEQRKTA